MMKLKTAFQFKKVFFCTQHSTWHVHLKPRSAHEAIGRKAERTDGGSGLSIPSHMRSSRSYNPQTDSAMTVGKGAVYNEPKDDKKIA